MLLDDDSLRELGEVGALWRPGAVPAALVALAREQAEGLTGWKRAGVGKAQLAHDEVRSDETLWLSPPPGTALWELEQCFEALRIELNQGAYLGLKSFELQLARYAPGGFYAQHLDTFRGDARRRITAIVYLNPRWQPGDGGDLELVLARGPVTVAPEPGTLVVFRSEKVPHQVRPAKAERYALTAWYAGG